MENFTLLSVPLPPMLLEMAGVSVESRYISLYYYGSKATWTDGRSLATFSYFHCWHTLTHHLAIAIHLYPYHLGSDDVYPTHALVCDRHESKLYIGEWQEVHHFLSAQHPPMQPVTPQEWEAIKTELAGREPLSVDQMQRLGMFDWLRPINPQMQQEAMTLIHWLDQFIDEALISRYIEASKLGEPQAILALRGFIARYERAIAQVTEGEHA